MDDLDQDQDQSTDKDTDSDSTSTSSGLKAGNRYKSMLRGAASAMAPPPGQPGANPMAGFGGGGQLRPMGGGQNPMQGLGQAIGGAIGGFAKPTVPIAGAVPPGVNAPPQQSAPIPGMDPNSIPQVPQAPPIPSFADGGTTLGPGQGFLGGAGASSGAQTGQAAQPPPQGSSTQGSQMAGGAPPQPLPPTTPYKSMQWGQGGGGDQSSYGGQSQSNSMQGIQQGSYGAPPQGMGGYGGMQNQMQAGIQLSPAGGPPPGQFQPQAGSGVGLQAAQANQVSQLRGGPAAASMTQPLRPYQPMSPQMPVAQPMVGNGASAAQGQAGIGTNQAGMPSSMAGQGALPPGQGFLGGPSQNSMQQMQGTARPAPAFADGGLVIGPPGVYDHYTGNVPTWEPPQPVGFASRSPQNLTAQYPYPAAAPPAMAAGGVVLSPGEPPRDTAPAGTSYTQPGMGMRRYEPTNPIGPHVTFGPKPEDMGQHLPSRINVGKRMSVRMPRPKMPGVGAVKAH